MNNDGKYEVENLIEKKPKNKLVQVTIVVIVILSVAALLLVYIAKNVDLKEIFSTNINYNTEKEVTVTDKGIADAVDKLYDATVIVEVGTSKGKLAGWGSGFVYKTDDKYGYILTNAHVVEESNYIMIVKSDESETEGELVGYDTISDVAVVKIPVKEVKAVGEIGNTKDIRLGDTVFAIGTPISLQYSFTVTRGILSGKNRMVASSSPSISGARDTWYMSLLQIDASINSGNSGGPLANSNGEVIGITNSKLSTSYMNSANIENMGFAIPIEDAMSVAEKLEKNGKVTRPVLGVSMTTVAGAKQNGIELPDSIEDGAVVADVSADSAAHKAGIKKGDVIIKLEDYKIEDYLYLKYYLYRYSVGDKIKLTIIRDGKEKTINVTLKD